jgi:hypothetical protein
LIAEGTPAQLKVSVAAHSDAQPTLDDVFLALTGRPADKEPAR